MTRLVTDGWRPVAMATNAALLFACVTLARTAASGDRNEQLGRSRRVIGGSEVTQGQWPYLVSLRGHIPTSQWWVFVTNYADYTCGGSLISRRWILTAAHCFTGIRPLKGLNSPRKWRVKAGDISKRPGNLLGVIKSALGGDVSSNSGQTWYVTVSKIVIHPQYEPADTFSWKNDLALVKLARDLPIAPQNPRIDVVPLPLDFNTTWPSSGTNCSLQGWGCTEQDGTTEQIARMLFVPVLPTKDCESTYGDLEDNRICAGFSNAHKGVCKGDSGGPLVCRDGEMWRQAGIISYTSSSNPADVPAVFTRVTKYLDWIVNITSTQ